MLSGFAYIYVVLYLLGFSASNNLYCYHRCGCPVVSRSQTVTLVTVWTTAVKRFVLSSPGSRVGNKWLLSASGTAKGMNLITYSLCIARSIVLRYNWSK